MTRRDGVPLNERHMHAGNPASTLGGPGDAIVLPRELAGEPVNQESELAIAIGRRARNIPSHRRTAPSWPRAPGRCRPETLSM